LNPETSIVCLDCGVTYTMPEKEFQRFTELANTVKNFRMPKRCSDCRRVRRNQEPQVAAPAPKAIVMPAPAAVVPLKEATAPETKSDEILLVLATKDFEDLVNGRPVVWRGVRVVLADIGFGVMKKAVEDAEVERARKLIKSNGK